MTLSENRAAVMYGIHDVRVEPRPVPELGPHEVLVEIRVVGVCGSDVHYYEEGRIGPFVVREPLVLGHEASGVVVELGPQVSRRSVGERVALEPGVPCGHCHECRGGHYNLCREVRFFATPPVDGAFARLVAIHEDFAYPVPEEMSDDAAALVEPLSVGVWACWKAGLRGGEQVLVTGAGPIGILAMQASLALGAREVTISDVNPARLRLAGRPGCRALDTSQDSLLEAGVEADVLIECSGNAVALAEGVQTLRPAGRVVAVGMSPAADASLPLTLMQTRELTLTGCFRYGPGAYPAAIALAASGRVDLDGLVGGHYGLEETARALAATRAEPDKVKVMVQP